MLAKVIMRPHILQCLPSIPQPLIGIFVAGFLSLGGCDHTLKSVEHPETGYEFPSPGEIMAIEVFAHAGQLEPENYQVPNTQWPQVVAALSPSQFEPSPLPWEVLCELVIHTKEGEVLHVHVYSLSDQLVGAFSVKTSAPMNERKYYRGGDTQEFLVAIRAAASLAGEE